MPRIRAVPVVLTASERKTLKNRVYGHKTPHRDWFRATIKMRPFQADVIRLLAAAAAQGSSPRCSAASRVVEVAARLPSPQ